MSSATADPFGTAALRAAVLDAWRASPTRFREDANVEEDYALGAYRDRLVVELAQNASDAARVGGVGGRLLLRLDDEGLTAANVGAPLDRAGVESLAAMRASSKSADAVGRFGVGFAAVLAVSDAPEVRSRNGGVRFDRSATSELLREDTTLSSLVEQRKPPALRVPFASNAAPPDGYDTAVVLPWRDDSARQLAVEAVSAIDEVLLLSLPDLDEVIVEIVGHGKTERHAWAAERDTNPWVMRHDEETSWWRVQSIEGGLTDVEEQSLPHEEALRRRWRASVALPVTERGLPLPLPGSLARVVHAPTPTDEPCGLPAVTIGDFGLDASRRHIAEGARTDAVADAIASAYVSLVLELTHDHGSVALTLVPQPALLGPIDHLLREQVRERLARSHWVPRACDGRPERISDLVALEPSDPGVVHVLAEHLVDLVDPAWVGDELRGLGLVTRPLHEVWDSLASLGLSPMQWHTIYDEVQRLDPRVWEGLPVPLADGRVVRGARTTMLAGEHGDELALLGVNVVHTDAEHLLLERLGARTFDVVTVLDGAFVRRVQDAVEFDPVDARAMISAAARLLVDADVTPGQLVAMASLPVPTRDGGWAPAASVVLPGSVIDGVAGTDVPRLLDAAAETATASAWTALGVLAELTPVTLHELPLDPDSWDDLMVDGADWCASVAERTGTNDPGELLAPDVTIVRGLEMVDGSSLTDIAGLLAAPEVMRALVGPTVVLTADGRRVAVASPGAWWLSEAPVLQGRSPIEVRVPGDERLAQFFPVVEQPSGVSQELLEAIGVHSTLERWLQAPDGVNELLDAMADDERAIGPELLSELYGQIAATERPEFVEPPSHLRAIVEPATVVSDADEVIVAVAPHHALVLQEPHIPGTRALADLLDVDVSDDAACAASALAGSGVERPVPQLPALDAALTTYHEHDELLINEVVVDWWVTDQGEVHAATLEGLARALAWASGHWSRRFEFAASLERPESAEAFDVERRYDR